MEVPTCPVCHRYTSSVVKFADYQPLPQGSVGRPNGYVYFCKAHHQAAQRLSHLPSYQAIPVLRQYQQQQSVSMGIPPGTVVIEHEKGRMGCLAGIALFFAILPLLILLLFSPIIARESVTSSGEIKFVAVAFILLMLSVSALFGHLSYWAFKHSRSKKPRLTLDSEGFVDLLVGDRRIFWRDITEMKFTQGRQRHVGLVYKIKLTLKENSEFKRNTFILRRMINKINPWGCDVVIDASRLETPGSYVFAQFEDFYKRFGNLR